MENLTKIRCRLSDRELTKHKRLAKAAGLTSQKFLYLHLMNFDPQGDPRLQITVELLQQMEAANDVTRKLKLYIECDPLCPDPEIRNWTPNTAGSYLEKLRDELEHIAPLLNAVQGSDPHRKFVPEENRKPGSDKLGRMLFVRVTPEEKEAINMKARSCNLSVSTYIRYLATGIQPQSREGIWAHLNMIKICSDLGRIKGIMRYWLSKDLRLIGLTIEQKKLLLSNCREALFMQYQSKDILQQFEYL